MTERHEGRSEFSATEAQKAFARQLGIEFRDDIKKSDISLLIDAAIDRRYERLEELSKRESLAYSALRAEIRKDLESEFGSLAKATPNQMVEEITSRGRNAILLHFDDEVLEMIDGSAPNEEADLQATFSEGLSADDVHSVILMLAGAIVRQRP